MESVKVWSRENGNGCIKELGSAHMHDRCNDDTVNNVDDAHDERHKRHKHHERHKRHNGDDDPLNQHQGHKRDRAAGPTYADGK